MYCDICFSLPNLSLRRRPQSPGEGLSNPVYDGYGSDDVTTDVSLL